MTSLIKNQVLKHLTKFFKDLAPEQLQLSAFKGSCDLSNLQLEEKVLMELLSFPAWIRINKAVCDQLSIRIPWTKIKSVPIQMNLNEVTVEVEVCEEFRDTTGDDDINQLTNLINNSQAPSKYGFVDRVIDGVTVTVNNILVAFKSKLMSATFNLSRVSLESRCPNWKPGELSLTRVKDPKRGQILLFKIVEWQTMRLEAKCLTDPNQAPLRLITNHAQCRLTIKKNLEDSSVVAARIFVIFEDILWVLTFAQFTSATSFVEYIFKLIKRSPMSNKTTLLDNQPSPGSSMGQQSSAASNTSFSQGASLSNAPPLISPLNTPIHAASRPEKPSMLTGNLSSASLMEQKFLCYDLIETSLHLYIDKIDAHLYDDIETNSTSGATRDSGGALQTTLDQIQVDCYPYSRAMSDRRHWYKWFDPSPSSRKQWIRGHFAEFDLMKMRKNKAAQNAGDSSVNPEIRETKLRSENNRSIDDEDTKQITPSSLDEQLLSLTVLVKIKDYCMHCVATRHSIRGAALSKFIETDKDYHMPSEMPALYLELNYYYYFDATNRMMVYEEVPEPLSFIHLSPTKLLFDSPTLVFLNSFQVNLSKAMVHLNDLFPEETTAPKIHCRVEILMPQIILPAKSQSDQKPNRAPSSLLIKSGKVTLSSSIYDRDVLCKLLNSIDRLRENPSQPINFGNGGSCQSGMRRDDACTNDWTRVWNATLINGLQDEDPKPNKVWAIQFEPVWMDFMNYDVDELSSGQRLEPIVEPVNASAFIHLDLSSQSANRHIASANNQSTKKRDIISILVSILDGSILANMDKVQLGFLQRLGMHVEKMIQQIREDASSVLQLETVVEDTLEINLTAYIRDIKARLILDKKAGTQSFIDGVADGPLLTKDITGEAKSTSRTSKLPSGASSIPLSELIDNHKASGLKTDSSTIYGNMMSYLSNATIGENKKDNFSSCTFVAEGQTATIIESDMLDGDDELDECIEVADDASCLLLDQSSPVAQDASETVESSRTLKSVNISNQSINKGDNGSLGSSSRSVGKSPIEEDLLINLAEIEESSNLFAKMDIKSTPKSSTLPSDIQQRSAFINDENCQPKLEQSSSSKSQTQQQDIETESISYLEFSMSQLMIRRITETKKRQKF